MRVLLVGQPSISSAALTALVEGSLGHAETRLLEPEHPDLASAIREYGPEVCVLLGPTWDPPRLRAFFDRLREARSGARVVVLDASTSEVRAKAAIREGAAAYVCSKCGPGDLLEALRASAGTARFLGSCVSRQTLHRSETPVGNDALSPRQRRVLEMIVSGARSAEVASRLGISERTVEVHRRAILKRLGAKNIAELTRIAVRQGVIEP